MSLSLFGCEDAQNPDDLNEQEFITTVELTFSPSTGDPLVFAWTDLEGDGAPVVDTVQLAELETYSLSVRFLNELEDPAEDITVEVAEESAQHQVFLTGDAVLGPATGAGTNPPLEHAYADQDAAGLPIGLSNDIDVIGPGGGDLVVTLRHLPPENDAATKVAGLAETVASDGFAAIPGDTDAQVTFPVSVQ